MFVLIVTDKCLRIIIASITQIIPSGLKVNKDTDLRVISKNTPGFLEIVHKNTAKTLQRMHYPSILIFDHRSVDKPTEKKVWYSIFFGIGALANASSDTTAKFSLHDGMGDLNVWKVCYNWDVVSTYFKIKL